MIKIVLPVLLSGIIIIAGIFAFIPVDKATTVHSTVAGSQLNNVLSTFDRDLSSNATATCAGGDFVVYYTFTNGSITDIPGAGTTGSQLTRLGIDDPTVGSTSTDMLVTLVLGNHTSSSGSIGGTAGEIITFFGATNGSATSISNLEDVGDLALTVVCQSGQAPTLVPTP